MEDNIVAVSSLLIDSFSTIILGLLAPAFLLRGPRNSGSRQFWIRRA